ncbi:alpha/beta hydrolase [Rhodovulum marinum]|uniref:Haloacetate dehalogenase n=1 Tax=Rhodovulum marinum TaxID=320662 RepID=A0A4R2PZL2_9RHOB|nr:alpha/beta hydrolase [Rhodovulum marinum]TCP39765.1 haloacetate dehalogenase [Rhodovulum marinum]
MTSGLPGFTRTRIETNGIALSVHQAGSGAPLVLLHGYPQNHMCWLNVAPALAERFHVIVPDLRGYGDSDAPADDADHTVYSKREMARDIVGLMDALGLQRAHVLGHDRGARVAYRLALDHPARVDRLGIIEIVPTGDFWAAWGADLALKAYHWTFLAQPAPWPERMIGADPVGYIDHTLASWTLAKSLDVFPPEALAAYRRQAAAPARIAAMCADYRAGATTDRRIDEADRAAGARIAAPLMFLWAETGFPAQTGRPAALWRGWADHVHDSSCRSGHFAMEEAPQAVLDAFVPFFSHPA